MVLVVARDFGRLAGASFAGFTVHDPCNLHSQIIVMLHRLPTRALRRLFSLSVCYLCNTHKLSLCHRHVVRAWSLISSSADENNSVIGTKEGETRVLQDPCL